MLVLRDMYLVGFDVSLLILTSYLGARFVDIYKQGSL